MKGDAKVIEYLNKALGNELVAINQYFLHAKMFSNRGLSTLGSTVKGHSIEEMKHADKLTDRILFLEGLPNFQDYSKLLVGENTKEMLECDLKLEQQAIPLLKEAAEYADSIRDFVSGELFHEILASEEDHVHWLETQLSLIDSMGLENYHQSQASD